MKNNAPDKLSYLKAMEFDDFVPIEDILAKNVQFLVVRLRDALLMNSGKNQSKKKSR